MVLRRLLLLLVVVVVLLLLEVVVLVVVLLLLERVLVVKLLLQSNVVVQVMVVMVQRLRMASDAGRCGGGGDAGGRAGQQRVVLRVAVNLFGRAGGIGRGSSRVDAAALVALWHGNFRFGRGRRQFHVCLRAQRRSDVAPVAQLVAAQLKANKAQADEFQGPVAHSHKGAALTGRPASATRIRCAPLSSAFSAQLRLAVQRRPSRKALRVGVRFFRPSTPHQAHAGGADPPPPPFGAGPVAEPGRCYRPALGNKEPTNGSPEPVHGPKHTHTATHRHTNRHTGTGATHTHTHTHTHTGR